MCGINGVIQPKDLSQAKAWVHSMNTAMAHRGPDADGMWSNHQAILGHRRLSIIDTSAAGNQPFTSSDGRFVIAFNGEIYNYIELRAELAKHHAFRTQTDTEVILAAFAHWGIEMVHKLTGMFAFALVDIPNQTTYLVRDRLGVKPLYYYHSQKGFLFASEVRSLLATGQVPRALCPDGLSQYLMYQTVHAPATIIKNVCMMKPGHMLTFKENGFTETCYWNAVSPPKMDLSDLNSSEVEGEVHRRLSKAVEIRMRADVPFGAFLSGGIDSSAIVGLMAGYTSQKVKTFSITFNEKQWDESTYSQLIAKKFDTDHHEIRLQADDFMKAVPFALAAMDHPSGDGPNTYVVSQVTRAAGVKMALSGIGGDELFAGYDVFTRLYRLEQKRWLAYTPQTLRRLIGQVLMKCKPSIASDKIAELLSSPKMSWNEAYPLVRSINSGVQISQYLKQSSVSPHPFTTLLTEIDSANWPTLSKISLAETNTYLQNVLLRDTDQMSMAHALEVREPFLDHHLVELAMSISDEKKFPHFAKKLLVESLGELLPPEIVHRPKMGFTFPWANWMRKEMKPFCESGLQALKNHHLINDVEVDRSWQRFLSHDKQITWSRIWPLVVLGQWIEHNQISE